MQKEQQFGVPQFLEHTDPAPGEGESKERRQNKPDCCASVMKCSDLSFLHAASLNERGNVEHAGSFPTLFTLPALFKNSMQRKGQVSSTGLSLPKN